VQLSAYARDLTFLGQRRSTGKALNGAGGKAGDEGWGRVLEIKFGEASQMSA